MKNQHLEAFGVSCLLPTHPAVKAIQQECGKANIHGTRVWDASFVLMDFLHIDGLPADSKVLDVGCGWGPLTFYLKKNQRARVISIDADSAVIPYLNLHATKNHSDVHFWQAKLGTLNIDELIIADYVMGCDICFWDSLRADWQRLFKRAKKAGVKQIFLADPGRSPFYALVDWADARFDIEFWEHEIKRPVPSQHYILQVNLSSV